MTILENVVPQKSDYGTPPDLMAVIHGLMGGIDLDPCSSAWFNQAVQAAVFITKEQNGLEFGWAGRTYLNPPGGKAKPRSKVWWSKLVEYYRAGQVPQAVYMSFALDSLQWSQSKGCTPILEFPTFIFASRIRFLAHPEVGTGAEDEKGKPIFSADYSAPPVPAKAPTKPNAITWLPPQDAPVEHVVAMAKAFGEILSASGYPCKAVMPL